MINEHVPRIKIVISLPICRVINSLVEVEDLHFHENFQSVIWHIFNPNVRFSIKTFLEYR